ncbi:MAG: hypothetical protein ACIAQU_11985, partial [Phycisphaerales bacterium JB064]
MRRLIVLAILFGVLGLLSSILIAWAGVTMHRGGWPDVPLTNTPINEPVVRMAEVNRWKVIEWHDATLTRRVGWGWRPQWREDPWSARVRLDPLR